MVGFYRWHVADPIMFTDELRVTIQQIGMAIFFEGQEAEFDAFQALHPAAGGGSVERPRRGVLAFGLHERVDDYCAAAFVACLDVQAVQASTSLPRSQTSNASRTGLCSPFNRSSADLGRSALDVPALFAAATVNVYAVPLVNPVTAHGLTEHIPVESRL